MTPSALTQPLCDARRFGLPATLTLEQWTQSIADFDGLCAYCQEVPVALMEHFVPVVWIS